MQSYIPFLHVALTARQVEQTENILGSVLLTKNLRDVIDVAYIMHTQDILYRNIAEQRDLLLGFLNVMITKYEHEHEYEYEKSMRK